MFISLASIFSEHSSSSTTDMTESQRAFELRKFFAPFENIRSQSHQISYDGALDAYAENLVWRLRATRAMVSIIDDCTQYFLAGAIRDDNADAGDDVEVLPLRTWFGQPTTLTPGGLCEKTMRIDSSVDGYPCFEVKDLSANPRFCHLPMIDGTLASYRFYAGTPITTPHGINIGSIFIFDNKPRPNGLTLEQRKYFCNTAFNIMRHLEKRREAAERYRTLLMSKGIATFLERTSRATEDDQDSITLCSSDESQSIENGSTGSITTALTTATSDADGLNRRRKGASAIVLDRIKLTLDRAARILRESLELHAGGVVFLDTAIGYAEPEERDSYFDFDSDVPGVIGNSSNNDENGSNRNSISPGQVRGFHDQYRPAKVLAISASRGTYRNSSDDILSGKMLQSFINTYPKGNIWYIDDRGYFSSLDQINDLYNSDAAVNPRESGNSDPDRPIDLTRQMAEANLLSKVFDKARQIIFLPIWDAGSTRWHSGCFVWSSYAVPVFTMDSELAYLSAFTNSVMVEISRLDFITANNMKSDFISSISHEFRSPLHGILASAEFLHDLELDSTQSELVSTIQNCGSTLLETINHVLDYSKINSFEKKGAKGSRSNELYHNANVAFLCENIVSGLMAAQEFHGIIDPNIPASRVSAPLFNDDRVTNGPSISNPVEIILDFEQRDWNFKIQAGALRRIVMNIFGNAQKYTESGFILVQLRLVEGDRRPSGGNTPDKTMLTLNVIDSGHGISSQYMERKLYTPFAQEDSFAPGVGLGLSIVWSIINQQGGKINIRSELGKGTDVEILLPLESIEDSATASSAKLIDAATISDIEAVEAMNTLFHVARGKTIAIFRSHSTDSRIQRNKALAWECIERYCTSWFGLEIVPSSDTDAVMNADIIIVEKLDGDAPNQDSGLPPVCRVLFVHERLQHPDRRYRQDTRLEETISMPIGPFKMARALLTLFEGHPPRHKSLTFDNSSASSLQMSTIQMPLSVVQDPAVQSALQGTVTVTIPTQTPPADETLLSPLQIINRPILPSHSLSQPGPPPPPLPLPAQNITHPSLPTIPTLASFAPRSQTSSPKVSLAHIAPLTSAPATGNTTPLRILAVDDNNLNLQLLKRYLAKRANDVIITAVNGFEALQRVKDQPAFDVMLLDISMPIMDGFEATRQIRQWENENGVDGQESQRTETVEKKEDQTRERESKAAYIVALTGLASRRDRDEAEKCGFDDFFTKPISFGMVGQLLARLSREKARREEGA